MIARYIIKKHVFITLNALSEALSFVSGEALISFSSLISSASLKHANIAGLFGYRVYRVDHHKIDYIYSQADCRR